MVWTRRRRTRKTPRKTRRTYRRRTYRRRSFPRRTLPTLLPDRYTCRLKYSSEVSMNPSEGATVANYVFRANDLYDPDFTGGGHQPMGFDSLCQYWNHFTVIGSRITVRPLYKYNASAQPGVWGIMLTDSGNECTAGGICNNLVTITENERGTKWGQALGENTNAPFFSSNIRRKNFSLRKFFNTPNGVGEDKFTCTSAASPTEVAYYEIWLCPAANVTDVSEQYFFAQIEYIVVCHEPKPQISS